jgi:hypothetical protein
MKTHAAAAALVNPTVSQSYSYSASSANPIVKSRRAAAPDVSCGALRRWDVPGAPGVRRRVWARGRLPPGPWQRRGEERRWRERVNSAARQQGGGGSREHAGPSAIWNAGRWILAGTLAGTKSGRSPHYNCTARLASAASARRRRCICAAVGRCRRARVMPVAPGVAHEEQRSLEDMGFAVLRGCLDQHTIAEMQEVLDRLTHPGSLAPGETFYDNRDEVRGAGDGSQLTAFGDHQLRLSNLQRRHEVFHQLIDHPRVLPLLHQYMREPRLAGDWHIRKECGPRSSWWHRGTGIDGWRVHPHDQRRRLSKQLNVAWLLDDQASGEGCLLVWPRSHLRDFHGSTLNQLSHDFPGLALEGSIEVEGKAGDAVIFVSVDSTSFLRSVSMAFLPHATCRFWAVLIVAAPISNAD